MKEHTLNEDADKCVSDALNISLIKLMNTKEMTDILITESNEVAVKDYGELKFKKPTKFVSSLNEAVASSLTVKTEKGFGSGFFISEDGYIITNYHVVADAKQIDVVLNDESIQTASVVRVDIDRDLALLKIGGQNYLPFNLSVDPEYQVGTNVFACLLYTSDAADEGLV